MSGGVARVSGDPFSCSCCFGEGEDDAFVEAKREACGGRIEDIVLGRCVNRGWQKIQAPFLVWGREVSPSRVNMLREVGIARRILSSLEQTSRVSGVSVFNDGIVQEQ